MNSTISKAEVSMINAKDVFQYIADNNERITARRYAHRISFPAPAFFLVTDEHRDHHQSST